MPTKLSPPAIRQTTIQFIRQFFLKQNYTEVDTPSLLPSLPLEPGLYSFTVTSPRKKEKYHLATSPESSLKKLIAQGIGNCFSLAHAFRALEDIGPCHQPEFMMLEWYQMKKNYHHIAKTTQKLFLHLLHGIQQKQAKRKTNILSYQGRQIDFSPPWPSFTLQQLFSKFTNINLAQNLAATDPSNPDWEPWFTQIMIDKIEPRLPQNQPVFIYDFPTRLSPLCQPCPQPHFSQRWELYIAGMEIANAYTELTNAATLAANFKREQLFRQKNKLPTHPYDQDLIKSTRHFPPCTGIAVGVDRLSMLFANASHINQVLYFPLHPQG